MFFSPKLMHLSHCILKEQKRHSGTGCKEQKSLPFMSNCCQHNVPLSCYVCLQIIRKKMITPCLCMYVFVCFSIFCIRTFNLKVISSISKTLTISMSLTTSALRLTMMREREEKKHYSLLRNLIL